MLRLSPITSSSNGGFSRERNEPELVPWRDIVELSRLDNGLGLYRYRYNWSDQVYVGVMAQEVEQIAPSAVMRGADGYLRVDYSQLGLKLMTWEDWIARRVN